MAWLMACDYCGRTTPSHTRAGWHKLTVERWPSGSSVRVDDFDGVFCSLACVAAKVETVRTARAHLNQP